MSVGIRAGAEAGRRDANGAARIRRPSLGHLAVGLAALLAFVANLAFLRSQSETSPVVALARTVEAGAVITTADLTTVDLAGDESVLAGLVVSTDGLDGLVARRALAAGALLQPGDLLTEAAPGGLRSMAIPVTPAHAAGGTIRLGDTVDVVDVRDGVAVYVVRNAPVVSVPDTGAAGLVGGSVDHVVIGLDEDQVLAVAAAISDGEVDVVVTTGADGD